MSKTEFNNAFIFDRDRIFSANKVNKSRLKR